MNSHYSITLVVNGVSHTLDVEPRRTLADILREDLRLTGTHLGCEQGICGACTVLLSGVPIRSCLLFGVQADGQQIRTVEGLSADDTLSDLQQAFIDHHSLQCGFCTPGFLMLAEAELEGESATSRERILTAMSANLCRCTGYQPIVDAVYAVARRRAAE
jgi:aerobic-type carbon monoxide dehydrogenase small subunit (CoxS/CutS family)